MYLSLTDCDCTAAHMLFKESDFMKKNNTLKGFIMGLVCSLIIGMAANASGIYENISVLFNDISISLNGEDVQMENMVYEGTTYVPLRKISELFGKVVDYDAKTNSVSIMDKEKANIINREIAFLVNGQPVRVDFFTQMINWYKLNSGVSIPSEGEQYESFKDFVRGEVVAMEVTNQYADELGIILFGTDIRQIENTAEIYAQNYGGIDEFKQLLLSNGITYDVYIEIQKNYALRSKLADVMTDKINTYNLIDYYYDNISSYRTEKVSAKQIFLSSTDDAGYSLSESVKAEKENKLWGIYNKIKSGEASFDDMMFMYSEDAGLKAYPNGYTFARGEMVKAFENAAFSMQKGEMSEVIESELGYHIILVTDHYTGYEPFENVSESIYNSLRNESYYKIVEPKISAAYVILNDNAYNNI